jgi:branched-chain amino acid transport system substrate-binding protein
MEEVNMKRKLLATLVGTALLSMVANVAVGQGAAKSAAAKAGAISGDKVVVGVMNDMSGLYADIGGPGSVEAAKMAVQDFGGKVLGKPVEVVFADHQNKPDVGATKAREWYDTQGVDMIVDVPTSSVAIAVGQVSAEKKRVFMDTGGATKALTNENCNAYTVHYVYDTYALANGTGKAIVQQGGKTWFFLTADYAFGHALEADTAAVVKANGGEVKGQVRHPLNASDFSSFLLQAQASKAQIVGLANAGGDTINSVKAANEFGLTKNQTLAGLLMFITDVHSLGLKTAQGMMLTDAWYWVMNEDTRKFGRRFFEKMKRMPSFDQAGVYSAVLTYLKAVQAAGTDDADKVMVELKKTKINDIFAKNGYIRQDGRMIHDMYLMQVKKPEESKYPWDYYNVKAIIPGEQAFQPLSKSTCPMIKK